MGKANTGLIQLAIRNEHLAIRVGGVGVEKEVAEGNGGEKGRRGEKGAISN